MTDLLRPASMTPRAMGEPVRRTEGLAKVTGSATYAFEQPVEHAVHLHLVTSTVAAGTVRAFDLEVARAVPGVLDVLTHESAARLADTSDGEYSVLQEGRVHFRGQIIGVVLAETSEAARHAAALVSVTYDESPHHAELRADSERLYAPEQVNAGFETDACEGDPDAALAGAEVVVDQTYTTPQQYNSPMEPHTTVAQWHGDDASPALTMWASTQSLHPYRTTLAPVLGLEPEQIRVLAPHVGGGFGSKGLPKAHDVLVVLAARAVPGRPVVLAVTRQQMFALTGYRTATIQHVRLGASADGRLEAVVHEVVEQTATVKEFAEQTAVATRMLYASPTRRTTHRLDPLHVPVASWMRAPGEAPGMFALEVAMDELAVACALDPVALRVRNEPARDPETGKPWSQRLLVRCLTEGAERFGWADRDPAARQRCEDGWWIGTGVASSTYPHNVMPGSHAEVERTAAGYAVRIGAVDIGQGARTILAQIAADALGVDLAVVDLLLGSSDLPDATVAGGSSGTTSWGSTIVAAVDAFRTEHGDDPSVGARSSAEMPGNPGLDEVTAASFGAQFAQVRVHAETGEIRADRLLGVFSVGRVVNPRLLRSQLLGGMIMGLSAGLHEDGVRDPRLGHTVTQDFASYHVASNADVREIEAHVLDEPDPHTNPMGTRGAGELGIVGMAAAVANAAFHATGVRVRSLPVTADRFLV